ncbi:hypothetical protein EBZ38_01575 [bacterium]|nr:hypothetical protein [bacterium]
MTGLKFDTGKPDYSLIPPLAELEVVKVLTFGAKKYGRENWKEVDGALHRYEAATRRHMAAFKMGEVYDPESGIHHYAHAICSLMFMLEMELEKRRKEERA